MPMIGIANGHSTITPPTPGLQPLVDAAGLDVERLAANVQRHRPTIVSAHLSSRLQ
jgi:hypothetical protein